MWYRSRRFLPARHWSNQELRRLAPLFVGDVANVSGWRDEDKEGRTYRDYFTGATSYAITNFTGTRGYQGQADEILLDLTAELPDELRGHFDVVFSHTVFEHIFPVWSAFRNFCEMSRDVAIAVVPWAQTQHESDSYEDYWRISSSCLRAMFESNGLTTVYESVTPGKDLGVYVLAIGSRHPERWRDKLRPHRPIREAAWWVGATFLQRLRRWLEGRTSDG